MCYTVKKCCKTSQIMFSIKKALYCEKQCILFPIKIFTVIYCELTPLWVYTVSSILSFITETVSEIAHIPTYPRSLFPIWTVLGWTHTTFNYHCKIRSRTIRRKKKEDVDGMNQKGWVEKEAEKKRGSSPVGGTIELMITVEMQWAVSQT